MAGNDQNSQDGAVSQDEVKDSRQEGGGFYRFWRGLTNPGTWSLKWRFLYFTGAMLFLGSIFQVFFLSYTLHQSIEKRADDNLRLQAENAQQSMHERLQFLLSQAVAVSSIPEVQDALAAGDRARLLSFAKPYADRISVELVVDSLDFVFFTEAGDNLLETSSISTKSNGTKQEMLRYVLENGEAATGLEYADGALQLQAMAPVATGGSFIGVVGVYLNAAETLLHLQRPSSTMALMIDASVIDDTDGRQVENGWVLVDGYGEDWRQHSAWALQHQLADTKTGEWFFRLEPLHDMQGRRIAALLLGYETRAMQEMRKNRTYQMGGLFISGAVLLWAILYFNVLRVERFLWRLKKIIIASHSSDFSERFESDHLHCLNIMNCHNEECPVYVDPSRICYLETGSEAISPVWRDTCIFLNKYDSCHECPVYHMRKGDELVEMRNVVNTMMRHWNNFLGRAGKLLAYVLRSQETGREASSLQEVSKRLEQMAQLTFFSHDLQGTLDKDGVYQQLGYVFSHHFSLNKFVLFEVDHDADRLLIALDASKEDPLCKRDVLLTTEVCRCKRNSEDVISFYNEVLCPYFNIDTSKYVRCCLPMIMGGQVGGVFSFVAPKNSWDRLRDETIPFLRKYLDEAAPVLSSLRLLQLTKEQALRDPLTHCHNRRFLDEFIAKYEPLSERENRRTGFLMADLDYFKQVNDDYGHEAGDLVLKQVVGAINACIRRSDLLIRYGGEEFLILLQDVQEGMAVSVAEKIRQRVEQQPLDLGDGVKIHKTISLGVAEHPADGNTLYKAIKFSDVALYEAKGRGRNQVVRFTPEMWQGEEY